MLLNQNVTKNFISFSVELYSMFEFNKCGEKLIETDNVDTNAPANHNLEMMPEEPEEQK